MCYIVVCIYYMNNKIHFHVTCIEREENTHKMLTFLLFGWSMMNNFNLIFK